MKNFILGFLVAAMLAAGGTWLFFRNSSQPVPAQVAQAQKYHCPMHPSYVSDKPGDCPICDVLSPWRGGFKEPHARHEPHKGASSTMSSQNPITGRINWERPDGMDLVPGLMMTEDTRGVPHKACQDVEIGNR
jgi:hypothetical protein